MSALLWIHTLVLKGVISLVLEHGNDESPDIYEVSSLCSDENSLCRSVVFSDFLHVGSSCNMFLGFWFLSKSSFSGVFYVYCNV